MRGSREWPRLEAEMGPIKVAEGFEVADLDLDFQNPVTGKPVVGHYFGNRPWEVILRDDPGVMVAAASRGALGNYEVGEA